MIYTLGDARSYLESMRVLYPQPVMKMGAREGLYTGGYAFQTVDEALKKRAELGYLADGWVVFGLDTTWENTRTDPDRNERFLVTDAAIVLLSGNLSLPMVGEGGSHESD